MNKIRRKKMLRRILCFILVACMIVPVIGLALDEISNVNPQLNAAQDSIIQINGKIADPDTSENMGFSNVPWAHDGRIWTDKSVAYDKGYLEDNEFEVTFSALSQSFPVYEDYMVPTDTVFVIDVSGSMGDVDIGGRSRISVLLEALNEAIAILQDANPQNRIAVVAYGGVKNGHARAERVLDLGRYEPSSADNFFSVKGTTVTVGATSTSNGNTQWGTDQGGKVVDTLEIAGSTPTQWGIQVGTQVFRDTNPNYLTIPAIDLNGKPVLDENDNQVMVTRRPNMILMTDGEPTMGWSDYLFENQEWLEEKVGPDGTLLGYTESNEGARGFFYGDGSYREMGLNILTVLTAAHMRTQMHDLYFDSNEYHEAAANYETAATGFFTIGLFGEELSDAARATIDAAMGPFVRNPDSGAYFADEVETPSIKGFANVSDTNPDGMVMGDLLREFYDDNDGEIKFNSKYREVFGEYLWNHARSTITLTNSEGLTDEDIDYTDLYISAESVEELKEAFTSIATAIQKENFFNVPTDNLFEGYDDDFGGYIVISDAIGKYMQFREITSFEFDGVTYDIEPVPFEARDGSFPVGTFEHILMEQLNVGSIGPKVDEEVVQNIINSSEGDSVKYYADENREFVAVYEEGTPVPDGAVVLVERYQMKGTIDPIREGGQTDLAYITFHVITAVADGAHSHEIIGFDEEHLTRNLEVGDQMVRWYIPASLIPQRHLVFDPETNTTQNLGNESPARIRFTVGLDEERVIEELYADTEYRSLYAVPGEVGAYYFYTNRHSTVEESEIDNITLSFYQPHKLNPFYRGGSLGPDVRGETKLVNLTETSEHVRRNFSSATPSDILNEPPILTDLNWMGNNGRLQVRLNVNLLITKQFVLINEEGERTEVQNPDNMSTLTFLIVGWEDASKTKEIHRETVTFPEGFVWNDEEDRWEFMLTGLPMGYYSVTESGGDIPGYNHTHDDGTQIVYVDLTNPNPDADAATDDEYVEIDDLVYGWAEFENIYTEVEDAPPYLRLRKVVHGLTAAEMEELKEDFSIVISSDELDDGKIELSLDEVIDWYVLDELVVGDEYAITEVNYDVTGFDTEVTFTVNGVQYTEVDLPYELQVEDEEMELEIIFNNRYTTTPTGTIHLQKTVSGLPDMTSINSDFRLNIFKGNNSEALYSLPLDQVLSGVTLTGLPYDTYTITEEKADAPGYTGPDMSILVNGDPQPGNTFVINEGNVGNTIEIEVKNDYTSKEAELYIIKDFEGLPEDVELEMTDFKIVITEVEPEAGLIEEPENEPEDVPENNLDEEQEEKFSVEISLEDALKGTTINLPIGSYIITEEGTDAQGFDLTGITVNGNPVEIPEKPLEWEYAINVTPNDAEEGKEINIAIVNIYVVPTAKLSIQKEFVDLPAGAIPEDFGIEIQGPAPSDDTIDELDLEELAAGYIVNLPVGTYTISEVNYDADGYNLSDILVDGESVARPLVLTVEIEEEDVGKEEPINIEIENVYEEIPTPTAQLSINKVFVGLEDEAIPPDFGIIVRGPAPDDDIVGSLTLDEAKEGETLSLPLGTYTISEHSVHADGYWLSKVTVNGEEITARPIIFEVELAEEGASLDIVIVNTYGEMQPPFGELSIQKLFDGIPSEILLDVIPSDFRIQISKEDEPDIVVWEWTLAQVIGEGQTIKLPVGEYIISEVNADANGYAQVGINVNGETVDRPLSHLVEITDLGNGGETVNIIIENIYEEVIPPTAQLIIEKEFVGLPNMDLLSDFGIKVEGIAPNDDILEEITLDEALDGYTIHLPAGHYLITEINTDANGYNLSEVSFGGHVVEERPFEFTIEITAENAERGDTITFTIINTYEEIVPPTTDISIQKQFVGLPANVRPPTFQIRIKGLEVDSTIDATLTLPGVENAPIVMKVPAGTYAITEANTAVDGYDLTGVTVNAGGQVLSPQGDGSYILTVSKESAQGSNTIAISVVNTYTEVETPPPGPEPPPEPPPGPEPPPEPPPGPQPPRPQPPGPTPTGPRVIPKTGDDINSLYVALILLSSSSIVGITVIKRIRRLRT